jgi:hypothetical protein
MEEFEQELRQAFERRPAPSSLKHRLMERLAAATLLTAALGGGVVLHQREEQREGEAARQQVLTALRITSHALNHMNTQLAAHGRAQR